MDKALLYDKISLGLFDFAVLRPLKMKRPPLSRAMMMMSSMKKKEEEESFEIIITYLDIHMGCFQDDPNRCSPGRKAT